MGVPRFLRERITTEQAASTIRRRLQERERSFLHILERFIFANDRSPYRPLLRAAGCEFGDIRKLVFDGGLRRAVIDLRDAGVYVSLDEFKGRCEAIRGKERFSFAEEDFDNPEVAPHFEARSGGTRGPATSVKTSLEHVTDLAVHTAVTFDAHGLNDYEHAVWVLAGLTPTLMYTKLSLPPVAWFYPLKPFPLRTSGLAHYLRTIARVFGVRLPLPRFLALEEPDSMATWLGALIKAGKRICVTTYASSAVRICAAARDRGLSLEGVCFITLGEPYTEAKRAVVQSAGARVLVRYGVTEVGIIGYGCAEPQSSDDMHFFSSGYELILRSRTVGANVPVESFLFTSLCTTAPKILLNVETGDTGSVQEQPCACRLGSLGLTTHLAGVRSFEKLSGEGMTFIKTDLLRIVEKTLPGRFGGSAGDYQVLEEEQGDGILRIVLVVSPRVGELDTESVQKAFLQELAQGPGFGRTGAEFWQRAGSLVVRRDWPVATDAGKILPFHVTKSRGG